jgi:hypothetical protein
MSKSTGFQPAVLTKYFKIEKTKTKFKLYCKKCDKGWEMSVKSDSVGNVLYLLNHAYSHGKTNE